ncbi:MAG: DNA repair protein RecN [Flavobacterium sp.]|nr:DNA repair protein RecN [Flavobacterium sp.]
MITSLSIENFALIDKLSIDFSDGFSIITGETGAGKSILLGALGLVLGKRADLSALKNKQQKCIVEAHFRIGDYNLEDFFSQNDLDHDPETIIRREILPSGKSRAFINDSPVNLQELQQLGNFLIDVHSQHQTRELSEEEFQFAIIDALAQNAELLAEYRSAYTKLKQSQRQLLQLQEEARTIGSENDYNNFLLEELASANLQAGEQQELERSFGLLSNVESIGEQIAKVLALANDEQYGISVNLREVRNAMQKLAGLSVEFQPLHDRIVSAAIELDDIFEETSRMSDSLAADPMQLEVVNQKLQTIYNLQKKHQVNTVEELLQVKNELEGKSNSAFLIDEEIEALSVAIAKQLQHLHKLAASISERRTLAVPILSEQLIGILSELGMPNARFGIRINKTEVLNKNGLDDIEFLFSANKGSDFGQLKKVASGGEMSRIMLAVKSILAQYSKLPTIIFDEIDTGVSGEIANKMGDIMKSMSAGMQVFAITHLPQIAAKGKVHYKVYKSVTDDQTNSELKLLSRQERVDEIAQMLSGSVITDSAINHAKALLD